MESKKDINYLFNEVSLYTKEEFNVFNIKNEMYEIDEEEFQKFCEYIGSNQNRLISYCHKCKKEFPFDIGLNFFESSLHFDENVCIPITMSSIKKLGMSTYSTRADINLIKGNISGNLPPYEKNIVLNNKIYYLKYKFYCTNNSSHEYIMLISIETKDGKFIVRKIGQNPSMLTVKGFDFDRYKKFLEKIDGYDDYKKADLSFADHFYAGAYTYLRRIFEKIIRYYLKDVKLEDDHMSTKIEKVKDYFDPRINSYLKSLYEILSKGIHELSEEESKNYYEYLKAIIDMQLEYIKTENDKDEQSKNLGTNLNRIINLLNK